MKASRSVRTLLLATWAIVVAMALPSLAAADPTYPVMNADGGIYWRSQPDWNTPVRVTGFGFYPETTIAVHCYQAGAGNVPGSADYMWEQATVVGGPGYGSGWVNEHFINDGQPINQPSPGVPPCGSSPPPSPSSPTQNGGYNRAAAAAWARKHAEGKPPNGTSCTWFVSQALWAGGLAKTAVWTSDGHPGKFRGRGLHGSKTAWNTPKFVWYIHHTYPRSTYTQISVERGKTNVPQAQLGDVITYDWDSTASTTNPDDLDHAAVITGFAHNNPQYPLVSEWSANGSMALDYVNRGWTLV